MKMWNILVIRFLTVNLYFIYIFFSRKAIWIAVELEHLWHQKICK